MDSSAVQLIQQTAIAANDNRQARMPEDTIALPDNFRIHDLEQYLPNRRRFRGALTTASLADFVAYVKKQAETVSNGLVHFVEGFIDADNLAAKVFFNLRDEEGKADHADWTATLKLKATAPYKALQAVVGKHFTQRDLIEWLEDWQHNVFAITGDDGNSISIGLAIDAIRKLEIKTKKETTHTDETRRAARTALEEVEAKAGPSLPDRIEFRCTPYLGLQERVFALRLMVLTSHEDPRLLLRIAGFEEHVEAIAQDFKAVLIEEVSEAATLTIGTFTP